MKTLRLIITFYKSFAFASAIITLSCMVITYTWGMLPYTALFWFKIVTLAMFVYLINSYKSNEFYYYKNLGVSKLQLWAPILLFDFIMYLVLIALTLKLRWIIPWKLTV